MALHDGGETTCCYTRSEKHWVTDPQGIAWEHFHTLANIPVFNEAATRNPSGSACCAPADADAGGVPLHPARVNDIARRLGLEVSRHAPVEETIERTRQALQR